MIKAILFDAGGVIVTHGSQIDSFAKIFKTNDKEKLWKNINHLVGPLCSGEISEVEYWKRVSKSENINPSEVPDNLWNLNYAESTVVNKDVLLLIKNLRNKYKTILISNTLKAHAEINVKRGVFEYFDDVVNSYEVHLSKDTIRIFNLALKRNKLLPEECIFIDDIQKFLDIANSIGIKGILYKNIFQLKNDLNKLGTVEI